jgi:UDP-N-acetylglucosamine 2-epimerase (non-hydrolysing)
MEFTNFINLLADSEFLMTDGGSNQEEASYLGLPCAILRSHTERREGLGKNAILLNYNIKLAARFIDDYTDYKKHPDMSSIGASKTVVDYLVKEFTL